MSHCFHLPPRLERLAWVGFTLGEPDLGLGSPPSQGTGPDGGWELGSPSETQIRSASASDKSHTAGVEVPQPLHLTSSAAVGSEEILSQPRVGNFMSQLISL